MDFIRVGQSYKWHHVPRNTFLIIGLYTDGNGIDRVIWEVTEGNEEEVGEIIKNYWLVTLKDSLREGDAYLVLEPMEAKRTVNKMKFI